jgi:hypothetical protein
VWSGYSAGAGGLGERGWVTRGVTKSGLGRYIQGRWARGCGRVSGVKGRMWCSSSGVGGCGMTRSTCSVEQKDKNVMTYMLRLFATSTLV